MKATDLMKESLTTAWSNKKLWLFGLFAAAGSGSGGGEGDHGALASQTVPEWLVPLLIVGGVLALVVVAMGIISEGALIDGVSRAKDGQVPSVGGGMKAGLGTFFRVLGLKLALAMSTFVCIGIAAVPAVLGGVGALPLWLGIATTVVLAPIAVPGVLTLYFVYQYALRFTVLEGLPLVAAARSAKSFLHGRIGRSLSYLGVSILGTAGSAVVMLAPIAVGAAVAGLVYLAAGQLPAIVAGVVVVAPLAACVVGALGTYRSSVWTLAYRSETALAQA